VNNRTSQLARCVSTAVRADVLQFGRRIRMTKARTRIRKGQGVLLMPFLSKAGDELRSALVAFAIRSGDVPRMLVVSGAYKFLAIGMAKRYGIDIVVDLPSIVWEENKVYMENVMHRLVYWLPERASGSGDV